jgi:hypothetical protein
MLQKNEHLLYAFETLINRGFSVTKDFTRTSLYRLSFLLDQSLKERDMDIRLPYGWYIHGAMVDSAGFQYQTGVEFSRYVPSALGMGVNPLYGEYTSADLSPVEKEVINTEAEKLMNKYAPLGWEERNHLIHEHYLYAPYEYQRTWKEFIRKFGDTYNRLSVSETENYLNRLLTEYPEDAIPECYKTMLKWDDAVRLSLDRDIEVPLTFIQDYWKIFSRALWYHHNENLPDSRVKMLYFKFETENERYLRQLTIYRKELLQHPAPDTDRNPEIQNEIGRTAYNIWELEDQQ